MNKVVLVTGSSRGIGKATIIEFASKGYNVVINYFNSKTKAEELKEYVENEFKIKALCIKADVSNEEEVKNMVSFIIKEFGQINVLVNNAGIVYDRDFDNIKVEEFEKTLKINVIGAFIVSREVSRYMKKGSTIVNVSSTNGTKTISPECLDYNISKIGLQSLTRDLAFQFKPNIRVNAIAIGWADTDMNKDLPKDYIKDETSKIYVERFADPSEIAKTIYFLASDESSYINSEIINIDGGYC
ncbi:MAG: SDR family oxidoreductase [Clostridia bacterium]|nr:SDR family oxidoreductase [Clostridia bacterium]